MYGHHDAVLRRAIAHHQSGQLQEAIRLYRELLATQPKLIEAHNNLGIALAALGRLEEAAACYSRARDIAPERVEAHINLGNTLHALGRFEDAVTAYRKALEIAPDDAGALRNLGSLLLLETTLPGSERFAGDRIIESFDCFTRHARLTNAQAARDASPMPHQIRHDLEQQDYLGGGALKFHLADAGRLPSPAVNVTDGDAVARQWQTAKPQIVVIDNLLTHGALEKLRRFCWSSTIWRKGYADGYLAALPEHGLACPLLAQIAEELHAAHPTVFGAHALRYLWAFKYDSKLRGVAIHADQAAVNVNFWITPDEANLNRQSGGLIVWDAAAPAEWDFRKYNGDNAAARAFLASRGARPVKIPYRANRAVIFDSDLFHETDNIVFKDGYLNRRINVTLLYGARARI